MDRVALPLGILASILAACVAAPNPSPTGSRPSATASATGPTATQSTLPPPVDSGYPTVDWRPTPQAPTLANAHLERVLPVGGGFAALGCRAAGGQPDACDAPSVWFSPDGLTWGEGIDLPLRMGEAGGAATSAVAAADGIVVAGWVQRGDRRDAATWFSADATAFGRAAGVGFDDATVVAAASLGDRLVVIGGNAFMEITGFRAWWSDGGLSWTAAQPLPDADASPVAVLPGPDGGILAWGYSCGICPAVTHWWTSRDGDRWTAHEVAPGLEGVAVTAVTATEAGYLAEGVGGVPDEVVPGEWLRPWSEDAWRGGRPPVLPDGARVRRLLSVGHGTLAAAEGTVGSEPVTYVLGRGPGDDGWRALAELRDLALIDVIQHPVDLARVMVVGHRGDSGTVVAWIGGVDWAP